MAFWSRSLVPIGRIWRVFALVFVAVQLWWQELLQVAEPMRCISVNKAVLSVLSSLAVLAYVRGAGQRWWGVSSKLPRRKMGYEHAATSSSNKRRILPVGEFQSQLLHLAGRGGEGELKRRLELVFAGWGLGCLAWPGADSAVFAAIPKLWLCFAMAIHGQKGGLAVLERCGVSSLLFLRFWRIFSGLRVALDDPVDPSGLVPGVGSGGYIWRQLIGGEALGLDCVFAFLWRVCSIKVQGPYIIFLSVEVLCVICHRLVI
jgi:hypothetical protein